MLRLEGGVLAWIFVWFVLAVSLPCAVITKVFCAANNMERLNEGSSIVSSASEHNWTRCIVIITYHSLLVLFLIMIAFILASNEKISRTVVSAPQTAEVMFTDMERFIKNTEMQYSFILTSSWEVTTTAVFEYLADVDQHLGHPLQAKIDDETHLTGAISNLSNLVTASIDISSRVRGLLKDSSTAKMIGTELQVKLSGVFKELTSIVKQCTVEDLGLCDTLLSNKIDVAFDTDEILSDAKLKRFQGLGEENIFKRRVEGLRQSFEYLPKRVRLDTTAYRTEVANVLRSRRGLAYKSTRSLEDFSDTLRAKISFASEALFETVDGITSKDLWRWLAVIGLSIILCLIWSLYVCGAPCGCGATRQSLILLTCGLALSCVLSLILWLFGTFFFLLGGHGEALICQPLYDEPHYRTLGDLLNPGGFLYEDGGFFKKFLGAKEEIRVEDVLRDCKRNKTAYTTFLLDEILNIDKLGDYSRWPDLINQLKNISVDLSRIDFFPAALEQHLEELQTASATNLTGYRSKSFGPVTNKDLNSFVDQLISVSRQIRDLKTIERLQSLTYTVKRIIGSDVEPLRRLQDDIVFKLTELEVLLVPLKMNVNRSLSDLRNVEIFIQTHGGLITEKATKNYTDTIEEYLQEMNENIRINITKNFGKCEPLWNCYDAIRMVLCQSLVICLNSLGFCCHVQILIFILYSPVVMKAIEFYRQDMEDAHTSITHRRTRTGLIIDEEGTWASPSRSALNRGPTRIEISSPPRSRQSPRRRSLRGRYESLRLIEPITGRLSQLSASARKWL